MTGTIYVLSRGGFGNLFFNYLIGYSLGKKYKMNVVYIPNGENPNRPSMDKYPIFFGENYINKMPHLPTIHERSFTYSEVVIANTSKSYVLDGYFQSYKYSLGYIDEIKEKLFKDYDRIKQIYSQLVGNNKTIMLHVRRGDYLKLPTFHPVQTDEYYKKSLDKLYKNDKVLVFSDDLEYVKKWDLLKNYNHTIVTLVDTVDNFMLMTLCDNFIIANSSFSLLAYYFREHKDASLCIPKIWFGRDGPKYDLNDLVEMKENVYIF
jgi:hypothetical protein